ncbi:syntaxin-6 isoform X2 [Copidosoma floridanum]|uniref:syntaxin-6 isoform X2 n=1 Tax=Copidosoma floridanum TaxID=29053 RepID=UPI0006C94892|nr:syntaxin-6 isoform X2 [Copidosoma floridanum]
MTLQDPYYLARDEVCRALNKTRGLYGRLQDLQDLRTAGAGTSSSSMHHNSLDGLPPLDPTEELEWTANELRNALRAIEWDIDELEDTIRIVEKNPNKFRSDNRDMTVRRQFIRDTLDEIKNMKDKINMNKEKEYNRTSRQPAVQDSPNKPSPPPIATHGAAKYTKLESDIDSPNRLYIKGISNPNSILNQHHDDDFKIMSNNTGSLKPVTQQFQFELDERQFMLDDFGNEMEIITDTKLDTTMKKMAKVFHLSNGRTKWITIGLLTAIALVLVISVLRK